MEETIKAAKEAMKLERRKQVRNSILGGLVILFLLLRLWPMSFEGLLPEEAALMRVEYREIYPGANNSITVEIASDSDDYREIVEILSDYRYHRGLRLFARSFEGRGGGGYDLDIDFWKAEAGGAASGWYHLEIICTGTHEVMILNSGDRQMYRVGYWGKNGTLPMMDVICAVLDITPRREGGASAALSPAEI